MPAKMCPNPQMGDVILTYKVKYDGRTKKTWRKWKIPARVKCTTCGRRVGPMVHDTEYMFGGPTNLIITMPPHKIRKWWKKKK